MEGVGADFPVEKPAKCYLGLVIKVLCCKSC